jgi:predicted nicotinamide N-methyase
LYKDSNTLKPLGKLIEVGSGCGMLGLVLAASNLSEYAVLTETTTVLDNLTRNVFENIQQGVVSSHQICTQSLRWEHYKEDIATKKEILTPHSFDTIVGTDVIFSIAFVKPLLKTLRKLSHSKSLILLCVPIRCEDAYALFLQKVPLYDLDCTDVTMELNDICPWGATLECKLLRMSKIKDPSIRSNSDHVTKKRRRER